VRLRHLVPVLLPLLAGSALAGELPAARVGRVAFAEGGATEFPGGEPARLNDPVMRGSRLKTEDDGLAELRLGATAAALAGGSEATVSVLDDRLFELALPRGRTALRLYDSDGDDAVAVAIPAGRVSLARPGRYDIEAGGDSEPARVTVFAGEARFAGGGSEQRVAAGQSALLQGANGVATGPAQEDDFSVWFAARDWQPDRLAAAFLVSSGMTGWETLDAHGRWDTISGWGWVWYPRGLPEDWAPYRYGHWRWVDPWGWSWIDNASWGFAPSHFGRWAQVDGNWGWVPGRYVAQPIYAPAVVAFLGTPSVGLSFAGGSGPAVGWFPLAPGEVYWPVYRADADHVRELNRSAVDDIAAIEIDPEQDPSAVATGLTFRNRAAASVVPRAVFTGGRPIDTALLDLPERRLQQVPAILGSPLIPLPAPPSVAALPRPPARPLLLTQQSPLARHAALAFQQHVAREAVRVHQALLVRLQQHGASRRIIAIVAANRPLRPAAMPSRLVVIRPHQPVGMRALATGPHHPAIPTNGAGRRGHGSG
jgi:hypothetical protein